MKRLTFMAAVACLWGCALPGTGRASIITFGNLSGANQDPFTTYMEAGFTVTPTQGNWFQAQGFGNPTPSIFAGPIGSPSQSAVTVTATDGGDFTFASVDLTSNSSSGSTFQITGFLNGNPVLGISGTIGNINTFNTESNAFPSTLMDTLVIQETPVAGVTSFNFDNINVTEQATVTPEPASLTLLGLGVAGMAGYGWRRRRTA
jgi:hypothetical protein